MTAIGGEGIIILHSSYIFIKGNLLNRKEKQPKEEFRVKTKKYIPSPALLPIQANGMQAKPLRSL